MVQVSRMVYITRPESALFLTQWLFPRLRGLRIVGIECPIPLFIISDRGLYGGRTGRLLTGLHRGVAEDMIQFCSSPTKGSTVYPCWLYASCGVGRDAYKSGPSVKQGEGCVKIVNRTRLIVICGLAVYECRALDAAPDSGGSMIHIPRVVIQLTNQLTFAPGALALWGLLCQSTHSSTPSWTYDAIQTGFVTVSLLMSEACCRLRPPDNFCRLELWKNGLISRFILP